MSAEKVIYNLLSNDTALLSVVPKVRMYAGVIPIDTTYPALCYNLVSSYDVNAIGLTVIKSATRIQVTAVAKTYPAVKALADKIRVACNLKQGTFNGVVTDSVIMDNIGADYRDDETGVFYSTVDFNVMHNR
jgi:hypothetical protein